VTWTHYLQIDADIRLGMWDKGRKRQGEGMDQRITRQTQKRLDVTAELEKIRFPLSVSSRCPKPLHPKYGFVLCLFPAVVFDLDHTP
ncbi:hypothetical protein STEG23_029630, partial [Scotinomys teguina]